MNGFQRVSRIGWFGALLMFAAAMAHSATPPQEPSTGALHPTIPCAADASMSYALYLPSSYDRQRIWPVLFVFDPGANGSRGVEIYRAAAERYGYVLAGSNNSRNGQPSQAAVQAMLRDVLTRFSIDLDRIYTAGMSGGARVAMAVALSPGVRFAGVIASSAGYPNVPEFDPAKSTRTSVPFALFMTAGSHDFNLPEMQKLDADLKSPHKLVVFEGGHQWLSSAVAVQALEWMESQAPGRRTTDR